MDKYPGQFSTGKNRTLQRRIAQWRQNQVSQEDKLRDVMINESVTPLYFNAPPETRLNK